jgi:hypothetical protein
LQVASGWEEACVKIVEIVPRERARLYGTLVAKEAAIRKKGRGTYMRVGRKTSDRARWRSYRRILVTEGIRRQRLELAI